MHLPYLRAKGVLLTIRLGQQAWSGKKKFSCVYPAFCSFQKMCTLISHSGDYTSPLYRKDKDCYYSNWRASKLRTRLGSQVLVCPGFLSSTQCSSLCNSVHLPPGAPWQYGARSQDPMVADLQVHVCFLNEVNKPVMYIKHQLCKRAWKTILILTRREAG